MVKIQNFWKTFGQSFNPKNYPSITTQYSLRRSYLHFIGVLVLFTLLAGLLYIPSLSDKPQEVQKEFEKISNLDFNIDASTSGAAKFGPLIVDLDSNRSLKNRGVLLTRNKVEYKIVPFGASTVLRDGEIVKKINDPSNLGAVLGLVAAFLAPYLLIIIFVYHLIKYTLIVGIVASLLIIIIRTSHGKIHAKPVYKAALFSTPFLMLELPFQTFISSWGLNTLVPFLLWMIFFFLTVFFLKPEDELTEQFGRDITDNDKRDKQVESHDTNHNEKVDAEGYVMGDIFAGSWKDGEDLE
jgi:hypothetical protein